MISILVAVMALAPLPSFRLESGPDKLVLITPDARISLFGAKEVKAKLSSSVSLVSAAPGLRLLRKGISIGSFDLGKLLDNWLADDSVWGGHKQANDLRYLDLRGGLYAGITDLLPLSGTSAVGTLTVRHAGPSGKPIRAQALVAITTKPKLDLRLVKILPFHTDAAYSAGSVRLFEAYGKRYVYDDQIRILNWLNIGQPVLQLPQFTGISGVTRAGYAVLNRSYETSYYLADFRAKKLGSLGRIEGSLLTHVSPFSDWLITVPRDNEAQAVRMPDQLVRPVPTSARGTWRDNVVLVTDKKVTVQSILSGKVVAELKR